MSPETYSMNKSLYVSRDICAAPFRRNTRPPCPQARISLHDDISSYDLTLLSATHISIPAVGGNAPIYDGRKKKCYFAPFCRMARVQLPTPQSNTTLGPKMQHAWDLIVFGREACRDQCRDATTSDSALNSCHAAHAQGDHRASLQNGGNFRTSLTQRGAMSFLRFDPEPRAWVHPESRAHGDAPLIVVLTCR